MNAGDPPRRLDLDAWLADGPVSVRVAGDSMEPTLRDGDRVEVVSAHRGELTVGDLIVFRAGGELVVHRLLRVGPEGFLEMGDNRTMAAHYPWPATIGRVAAAERDGFRTDLSTEAARRTGRARAARSLRRHRAEGFASKLPGSLLRRLVRGLARRVL